MRTNYILIAGGNMSTPALDICIDAYDNESAIRVAEAIVKKLAVASYTVFKLFDTRTDNHVRIARLLVTIPEPTVKVM